MKTNNLKLDELIIAVYCRLDDELKSLVRGLPKSRIRQNGPTPILSDSEVLCLEVVGQFLGHNQDKETFDYFCRHHLDLFPRLEELHRTTYTRQSAKLWRFKEALWQRLVHALPHHEGLSFLDSLPLPMCRFARASHTKLFKTQDVQGLQGAYGFDHVARQTFWGFRLHVRVAFPGVITAFSLTGADQSDVAVAPQLLDDAQGLVIADRNYHSPYLQNELARTSRARLLTPFKNKTQKENPQEKRLLSLLRYRIETVFSQWCDRLQLKTQKARDTWHLQSRLLRAVLTHTLAIALAYERQISPLQFRKLLD